MAIVQGLISLILPLALVFSIVNIVYPIKSLGIPSRKRESLVLLGTFVGFILFGVISGDAELTSRPSTNKADKIKSVHPGVDERTILAKWRTNVGNQEETVDALILTDPGQIVLETTFINMGGTVIEYVVSERPTHKRDERRFQLVPENTMSEYITVSASREV